MLISKRKHPEDQHGGTSVCRFFGPGSGGSGFGSGGSGPGSGGSGFGSGAFGPDAGAADGHRAVRRREAAPPSLPDQDQDVLVDGDRDQVRYPVGTGTEAAAALDLPEGGGDPGRRRRRRRRPEQSDGVVVRGAVLQNHSKVLKKITERTGSGGLEGEYRSEINTPPSVERPSQRAGPDPL